MTQPKPCRLWCQFVMTQPKPCLWCQFVMTQPKTWCLWCQFVMTQPKLCPWCQFVMIQPKPWCCFWCQFVVTQPKPGRETLMSVYYYRIQFVHENNIKLSKYSKPACSDSSGPLCYGNSKRNSFSDLCLRFGTYPEVF